MAKRQKPGPPPESNPPAPHVPHRVAGSSSHARRLNARRHVVEERIEGHEVEVVEDAFGVVELREER